MARITVEDCVTRVPNRFELIMLAAHRARELSKGVPPTVDFDDDKFHVIALREIAAGTVDPTTITQDMQTNLLGIDDDAALDLDDSLVAMEAPSGKLDWDRVVREWDEESARADDDGPRTSDPEAPD